MYIAVLLIIIVIIISSFFYFKKNDQNKELVSEVDKREVKKSWIEVEKLLSVQKEMNFKLAIIEANKILDQILQVMDFPGENMKERLKMACYTFPQLKKCLWIEAVYQKILKDQKYVLKSGETRYMINLIKKALKKMKIL